MDNDPDLNAPMHWPAPALCAAASAWLAALALLSGFSVLPSPGAPVATPVLFASVSLALLLFGWQWPRLNGLGLADALGIASCALITATVVLPLAFGARDVNVPALALIMVAGGIWIRGLAALSGTLAALNLVGLIAILTSQGADLSALGAAALWLTASLIALACRHWWASAERLANQLGLQREKLGLEKQRHLERMDLESRRRRQLEKRLAGFQSQLEKSLRTDPLTRLGNRQAFNETHAREFRRACREQQHIALMFCSIDAFRSYNQRLGNDAGDALIKRVAALIDSCIGRPTDLVARYEGTVFAVVLPNTDVAQARLVGNRVRSQVEDAAIAHPASPAAQHVTLSIGLSSAIPYADLSPERLMALAAAALKDAKDQGRNRVHVEAVSAVDEIQPAQRPRSPRHLIPPARR